MSTIRDARLNIGMVAAISVIALLLIYPEVWSMSPFGDDYMPPMAEVHRGIARGPWSFFVEPSTFPFYRPLTFMSIWLAGEISMDSLVEIIHGLHFFWVAACLGVLALWARTLDFSRFGFAFAALVFITHPALAGPLAAIDGFQRVASTAWTWLGAWFVLRTSRGSLGGDLAAAACLVVGLGFAEYALGLVPLALLAALWRRRTGRSWASMVRLAALLGIVVLGWYVHRSQVLGAEATAFVSLRPDVWTINAGQLLAVSLFWGNSVWSMLGPQPWAAVATAGAIVLALVWIGGGIHQSGSAQVQASTTDGWLARADSGLLIPAALVNTFPMLIMPHVSEMFATPVLMSVALIAGKAAEGWLRARQAPRRLAFAAAALAIVVGAWAGRAKMERLAAAGRQSDHHVYQILSHIPPDANGWRIATLFDATEPQPSYSIFAPWPGEWNVVRTDTLAWFHPGQDLLLERLILPGACDRADQPFDLILKWDRAAARYLPVDEQDWRAECRE